MTAQARGRHAILEVFVHEDRCRRPAELAIVFRNRSHDHARDALLMLYDPTADRRAARVRQGFANAGPSRSSSSSLPAFSY